MLKGTITKPSDAFIPYPSPEDVFASNVEKHAEFLTPLASIDLSKVYSDLTGWAHFVAPVEPDGVCVCVTGDMTQEYHNYLCRENTIGYRLIDNKLELATDFRYFFKEKYRIDGNDNFPRDITEEEYKNHLKLYQDVQKDYIDSANYYKEHGSLKNIHYDDDCLAIEIGSLCESGNWNQGISFPQEDDIIANKEGFKTYYTYPLTEDGRRFRFIGVLNSHLYVDLDGDLYLFYDPETKTVLTTVEYS